MLAPRKKLWSTPDAAVDAAIKLLSPSKEDVVYDIGCGDARFLVTCAQQNGCRCIGIEIDEDRAKEANEKVVEAGVSHLVTIRVGNALEMDFSDATAVFLYLVPRGLRIMLPLLTANARKLKVATYMAGFEGVKPIATVKITPSHQPDARWPVFLFELGGSGGMEDKKITAEPPSAGSRIRLARVFVITAAVAVVATAAFRKIRLARQ